MKYPAENAVGVVREAVQRLSHDVNEPQLRSEAFSALYLFAGLRQLQAITQKVLKV